MYNCRGLCYLLQYINSTKLFRIGVSAFSLQNKTIFNCKTWLSLSSPWGWGCKTSLWGTRVDWDAESYRLSCLSGSIITETACIVRCHPPVPDATRFPLPSGGHSFTCVHIWQDINSPAYAHTYREKGIHWDTIISTSVSHTTVLRNIRMLLPFSIHSIPIHCHCPLPPPQSMRQNRHTVQAKH